MYWADRERERSPLIKCWRARMRSRRSWSRSKTNLTQRLITRMPIYRYWAMKTMRRNLKWKISTNTCSNSRKMMTVRRTYKSQARRRASTRIYWRGILTTPIIRSCRTSIKVFSHIAAIMWDWWAWWTLKRTSTKRRWRRHNRYPNRDNSTLLW